MLLEGILGDAILGDIGDDTLAGTVELATVVYNPCNHVNVRRQLRHNEIEKKGHKILYIPFNQPPTNMTMQISDMRDQSEVGALQAIMRTGYLSDISWVNSGMFGRPRKGDKVYSSLLEQEYFVTTSDPDTDQEQVVRYVLTMEGHQLPFV